MRGLSFSVAFTVLLNSAVMLLVVNLAGEFVLLVIQRCTVAGGQVAVVRGAHAVFFPVQCGFLGLQISGFSGGQLPALDAVCDAVLLIFLALVDGGRVVVRRRLLREGRGHYRGD